MGFFKRELSPVEHFENALRAKQAERRKLADRLILTEGLLAEKRAAAEKLAVAGAAHLMRQDPLLAKNKPSVLRPWIWLEWQRQARAGLLPSVFWLAGQELRYLNPWYHPGKEASTEQALAYLDSSPAAQKMAA